MTRPPFPSPHVAPGIAALLGGLLCTLLAALLGVAKARPRDCTGTMACVLRAEAAIDLELEPAVEWVAVPAPWRNGIWRVKPRRGAFMAQRPRSSGPRAARVRAPPCPVIPCEDWRTGMA